MSGSDRIYIAGPIRTSGNFMANVAEAIKAAEAVHEAGHIPFIPHTHNQQWDLMFPKDRDTWVEMDVQWVDVCDALIRLDGESEGADREIVRAEKQGIPVFYSVKCCLNALSQNKTSTDELVPDGGSVDGSERDDIPEWAIICSACGEPHHYDCRGGWCQECGAFLPDATQEQHDAFTEWYVERCEAFERGEIELATDGGADVEDSERPPLPPDPIDECPICGTPVTGEWGYDKREDVNTLACDSPLGERHQVTAGGLVFSVRMNAFVPPGEYRPLLERIASARLKWRNNLRGTTYSYAGSEENDRSLHTDSCRDGGDR